MLYLLSILSTSKCSIEVLSKIICINISLTDIYVFEYFQDFIFFVVLQLNCNVGVHKIKVDCFSEIRYSICDIYNESIVQKTALNSICFGRFHI